MKKKNPWHLFKINKREEDKGTIDYYGFRREPKIKVRRTNGNTSLSRA